MVKSHGSSLLVMHRGISTSSTSSLGLPSRKKGIASDSQFVPKLDKSG